MMGTFFLLNAETAAASSESGFGLNLDILGTNLINLGILIVLLLVYGSKVVGNILSERRAKIEQEIREAETRASEASAALDKAKKNLEQAQANAAKIRQEAEVNAQKTKESILAKGQQEIERIKATAAQDLNTEQEKAIAELRQRVATNALQRVEARLGEILDEEAQRKLIDRSIAQLGGES